MATEDNTKRLIFIEPPFQLISSSLQGYLPKLVGMEFP
jgi:hypothetical protein